MAESYRDEIAKLESMYAANPEGRVFTHLAEAYRKAGDLARAREVLEDGLRRHSDSASGYVVLGRLMQDLSQPQEAAAAFGRVLELDPENRVALRALGELARAAGEPQQAMAHFRQLLALDPSDESVQALVADLETGPAPVATTEVAAEAPAAEVVAADTEAAEAAASEPELVAANAPAEAVDAAAAAPAESPPAEPALEAGMPAAAPLAEEPRTEVAEAPAAAQPAGEEAIAAALEAAPAAELIAEQAPAESGESVPVAELPGAHAPAAAGDVVPAALEVLGLTPGAEAEPGVVAETSGAPPDAGHPAGWLATGVEPEAPAVPGSGDEAPVLPKLEGFEPSTVAAGELEPVIDLAALPSLEPADAEPTEGVPGEDDLAQLMGATSSELPTLESPPEWETGAPAEVVTETMADLYRAQGHLDRAAEVYRALLRERPGDEALERKLVDVELAQAEGELAPEPLPELPAAAQAAPDAAFGAQESSATMEAVWGNGGQVASAEPTPYAWESAAPEEAAGPPISAYLRGLVAWRRPAVSDGGVAPAASADVASAPDEAGDVAAEAAAEPPVGAAPDVASSPYGGAVAEPPAVEAEPWAPTPEQTSPLEPWSAPAPAPAPTWADEAAAEPWSAPSAPAAPADDAAGAASDQGWHARPGSEAVPEEPAAQPPQAEAGPSEGPGEDDDLEMFRAWLQSLKK